MDQAETICLIDGSGYIFRAFYALPPMNRPDGTPVNAVYGFINMMMQLIEHNRCSHLAVVFDAARENFRNKIYPPYKATRREIPPDLIPQFSLIRRACLALNVPCVELAGYEADDLIATYARLAVQQGFNVEVVSADKDLMQLMSGRIAIYDPMKKKTLSLQDVQDKFGVFPGKVTAVQALMGDTTDNVPGARGIGPKTAAELINQFGSVENLFNEIDKVTPEKRKLALIRDKEQIFISQKLVTLDSYVPLSGDLSVFAVRNISKADLAAFLTENNFKSLLAKIDILIQKCSNPLAAVQSTKQDIPEFSAQALPENRTLNSPALLKAPKQRVIQTAAEFQKIWAENLSAPCAFRLYANAQNKAAAAAFAFSPDAAYYLPLIEETKTQNLNLFSLQEPANAIEQAVFLKAIQDKSAPVFTVNLKEQLHFFNGLAGLSLKNAHDTALLSYVLDGTRLSQNLSGMVQYYFKTPLTTVEALSGTGKAKLPFENLSLEQKAPVCMQEAAAVFRLYQALSEKLKDDPALNIYRKIEQPLIQVLFSMEHRGILIDKAHLKTLNELFGTELNRLINVIYELAGEEFNINSPSQVGYILFEKMGLPGKKKNQSGGFSTDVKTLTDLAQNNVEIARQILEYRLYGKLKSTYIEALTHLADKNSRVHTTFLQTATNTGRLSSVDPNLQNIPIRTPEGREIRRAFIAKEGCRLICADYSQIELRLMAHVAGVKELQASFHENADIHRRTAAQIFHVPPEKVDSGMRRQAKAINFGIIYGMSAFGLAEQLKISRSDAKRYIDNYFSHYPEIQAYMRETVLFAQKNGYVSTPFGRKCFIQQINDPKMKGFAARAAVNAPIQGGAADIIKMAMNALSAELSMTRFDIALLLQVHDELVFEVKAEEAEEAAALIKKTMETVVRLSVPLVADIGIAANWKEAH